MAKSRLSFKAIVYIITLAFSLVLGWYLTKDHGAVGMTIGLGTGWLLAQIIMTVYYQRSIHLNMIRFFKELIAGILPVGLVLVAMAYGLNEIPGEGWINFILKGVLFAILFMSSMYYLGMNTYEKELLMGLVSRFKNRKDQ